MCGIYGVVAASGAGADEAAFAMQRDMLTHRGPDGSGTWRSADGRVALGHRRLAIIDLSATGGQPMHDGSGSLHITFNGEIYNHPELRQELARDGFRFYSNSDTEVILAAYSKWGEACLARLNGMFSFALYDEQRRTLFVARDRAGEKPLFYYVRSGELRFASELKALLAAKDLPTQIDPDALDCYLAFGYVPGELSILRGFKKLPPAHAMTFVLDGSSLRVWRYWSPPAFVHVAPGAVTEDDLVTEFESLLEHSVRRQLVADVPVGVLLSGGVDSSLTTAMAARSASRIQTFTVTFPGHAAIDESKHARLVARHFGTDHVELEAEASMVELLLTLAPQFDEPMADSSMIPTYLLSKLVRTHCKVALGGDGGDELFGGYMHHSRLLRLAQLAAYVPARMRHGIGSAASGILPPGFKGRNWLQAFGADFDTDVPLVATLFSPSERGRLLHAPTPTAGFEHNAERIRRSRLPVGQDLLQRATRMDFENYLPEDILVKVDRASMLASLEVRSPWLDHRLIEFAFARVPSRLKATAVARKILPKRLARRLLPKSFDVERKQGFSVPLNHWLRGGAWRDFFREVLLDSTPGFFDSRFVNGLLEGQRRGRNNSERLFALVLFELWRRQYAAVL